MAEVCPRAFACELTAVSVLRPDAARAAVALQSFVEFSLQMPGNAAMFAALCGIALHDPEAA